LLAPKQNPIIEIVIELIEFNMFYGFDIVRVEMNQLSPDEKRMVH